jgi:hypothetical protein
MRAAGPAGSASGSANTRPNRALARDPRPAAPSLARQPAHADCHRRGGGRARREAPRPSSERCGCGPRCPPSTNTSTLGSPRGYGRDDRALKLPSLVRGLRLRGRLCFQAWGRIARQPPPRRCWFRDERVGGAPRDCLRPVAEAVEASVLSGLTGAGRPRSGRLPSLACGSIDVTDHPYPAGVADRKCRPTRFTSGNITVD